MEHSSGVALEIFCFRRAECEAVGEEMGLGGGRGGGDRRPGLSHLLRSDAGVECTMFSECHSDSITLEHFAKWKAISIHARRWRANKRKRRMALETLGHNPFPRLTNTTHSDTTALKKLS
jgi:hypothetical protein